MVAHSLRMPRGGWCDVPCVAWYICVAGQRQKCHDVHGAHATKSRVFWYQYVKDAVQTSGSTLQELRMPAFGCCVDVCARACAHAIFSPRTEPVFLAMSVILLCLCDSQCLHLCITSLLARTDPAICTVQHTLVCHAH